MCCQGRIQKRRPRLCNGRIARHQEGRTVGRVTGVWTQGVNLLNYVAATFGFKWFPGG